MWTYELPRDKTSKMTVRPAKTQISLGIRPVWSESSLSAWRKLGSLATHRAHSEDSDQTGQMPRLIWVFAGRTLTLLVLSCRGSYNIGSHVTLWFRCESAFIYRQNPGASVLSIPPHSVHELQRFWSVSKIRVKNESTFWLTFIMCTGTKNQFHR